MRLSKLDAAARLEVSPSTIDRMIRRGELKADNEPHGTRYKVWVLFDDESEIEPLSEALDESLNANGQSPESPGDRAKSLLDESEQTEWAGLREKVKYAEERVGTLLELADYHKQLLADSEWRFQEVLQQLKQSQDNMAILMKALPAAAVELVLSEQVADEPVIAEPPRRWRWWPFGRN